MITISSHDHFNALMTTAIACNQALREQFQNISHTRNYIRDFGTIRVNAGVRTGKSTWIAKNASHKWMVGGVMQKDMYRPMHPEVTFVNVRVAEARQEFLRQVHTARVVVLDEPGLAPGSETFIKDVQNLMGTPKRNEQEFEVHERTLIILGA